MADRRGAVEHHDAFRDFVPLFDPLAANDERGFHLFHRDAAVSFAGTAVIGREEYDRIVLHTVFFEGFHNLADIAVDLFAHFEILVALPAAPVSGFIRFSEGDERKERFLASDIEAHTVGQRRIARYVAVDVHGFLFIQAADGRPVVTACHYGVGPRVADRSADTGEESVFTDHARRQVGNLTAPCRIAVQFRPGSHQHRGPVDGARRRKHAAPFERIAAVFQGFDVRECSGMRAHDVRTESVAADQHDVFGLLRFAFFPFRDGSGQRSGCDNQQ